MGVLRHYISRTAEPILMKLCMALLYDLNGDMGLLVYLILPPGPMLPAPSQLENVLVRICPCPNMSMSEYVLVRKNVLVRKLSPCLATWSYRRRATKAGGRQVASYHKTSLYNEMIPSLTTYDK